MIGVYEMASIQVINMSKALLVITKSGGHVHELSYLLLLSCPRKSKY